MSSIDKGIENVVRETGRNVTVTHRGNYIVGLIHGEEVFRIADRYGYVNATETAQVKQGIADYDRRKRQEREAAIRMAREQEERLRREREEAARRAEYASLQDVFATKNTEITKDAKDKQRAYEGAKSRYNAVLSDIERLRTGMPMMDFSALQTECRGLLSSLESDYTRFKDTNKAAKAELDRIYSRANASQSIQQSKSMKSSLSHIQGISAIEISSYKADKFKEKVTVISKAIGVLSEVSSALTKLKESGGEIRLTAQEALSRLNGVKISSEKDVVELTKYCQKAVQKIKEIIKTTEIAANSEKLGDIINAIAEYEQLYIAYERSTYEQKDFRKEVVESALAVTRRSTQLQSKDFTTCSTSRITKMIERCSEVLLGTHSDEDTLEEMRRFTQELDGYEQSDKLHRLEYENYCQLTEEMIKYGVDKSEIPQFNPYEYTEQRKVLAIRLNQAIRQSEITETILTDLNVRNVMENMGYEVFSTIGDKEGYVIETLYTRKGYDGVLWQVITMADGSIHRRIIGVNKGETQTDPQSVKQIASEMEQMGEPQAFLQAYNQTVEGGVKVNTAIDSDSEYADQAILANGYHYLSPEALKLYEERVAEDSKTVSTSDTTSAVTSKVKVKTKARQVKTTAQNAVSNSASLLRNAVAQSRALSSAN